MEATYELLGHPATELPSVHESEIVEALAQHYGFPTCLVDLTLDPFVAGFFATHNWIESRHRYEMSEKDGGIVFRWPAVTKSKARLSISICGAPEAEGDYKEIPAVDLTHISPFARRPYNQRAVLANPVFSPHWVQPPRPFRTQDFFLVDMARLANCEQFLLPPAAAIDLCAARNVSEPALFPNRVDLGYSYLSLIALLSLLVHHPDETPLKRSKAEKTGLRRLFTEGIRAAQTILEWETRRLVRGYPLKRPTDMSLFDAELMLLARVEMARSAIDLMPKMRDVVRTELHRLKEDAIAQIPKRLETFRDAIARTVGPDDIDRALILEGEHLEALLRTQQLFPTDHNDILPTLEQRVERVKEIMAYTEKVPSYAVLDTSRRVAFDMLASDAEYESEVRTQIEAVKSWLKDVDIFPKWIVTERSDMG